MRIRLLCALLFSSGLSLSVQAQEQRWFEVELLVFSQTPASGVREHFDDVVTPIKPGRAYDLLTAKFQPDVKNLLQTLPFCPQTPAFLAEHDRFIPLSLNKLCIFETQPAAWQQHNLFEGYQLNAKTPAPEKLDRVITGNGKHQQVPYLADASALQLTELANKLVRQSGKQLLLHTVWRQAPVTERRAIASRWYAGTNFSAAYDYWGQPKPAKDIVSLLNNDNATHSSDVSALTEHTQPTAGKSSETMQQIEQLLQLLQNGKPLPQPASDSLSSAAPQNSSSLMSTVSAVPDQVWQLDGLFKLHLDHYLFVNTEFNLRQPADDRLNSIYVRQSRRVISGEIHYLDHPYLGIVLQIRRFEPPIAQDAAEEVTTDLPN